MARRFPSLTWGRDSSPSGANIVRPWVAAFMDTKLLHSKPIKHRLESNFMFRTDSSAKLR